MAEYRDSFTPFINSLICICLTSSDSIANEEKNRNSIICITGFNHNTDEASTRITPMHLTFFGIFFQ